MPSTLTLVPSGKIRCIITDKLRHDTPEEHIRQRFARSLLDVYDYKREDIEVEFRITMGRSSKSADLVVFPPGADHTQNNAYIIIECKREEIKPTDRNNGIGQLESYLSACLNARFGVWIGSELRVVEKVDVGGKWVTEIVTDIPRFGADAPQPLSFQELVQADDELILIFRRCHNYIYGNQGLQKEPAFHELLKLIFCKVQDESTTTGKMRFFISNEDRRSELGQRSLQSTIRRLFEEVKSEYPYIFDRSEEIKLEPRVLAYIVGELQRFSLLETTADVKGIAYEQLVGSNLRGDRGEFFTPRAVCEMAVQMVLATYPEDRRLRIVAADPACGTGGFLREMLVAWQKIIEDQQRARWPGSEERIRSETRRILKDTADKYLTGIDFNPALVRAAQMNLVMHGDGSTNVYHANSLLPPGEWPRKEPNNVHGNVRMGTFDVVVTNPPFGSKIPIDDAHILAQYELASFESDSMRTSMPPEQLFIERCLQLLKPGGRLAIVLPDSILSNPGLAWLRRWILTKTRVIASIDLPAVTFEPYTGTQTSVLLLQKKTERDLLIEKSIGKMVDYEVFMSIPEAVGKDRRGNTLYVRTPEGQEFEYEVERNGRTFREKIVFNQLVEVVKQFRHWVDQGNRMEWLNE